MHKEHKYNLTSKEYRSLCNWAENIYNTVVILHYFCSTQTEIEELYNLTPVMSYLRTNADNLNAFFINYKGT